MHELSDTICAISTPPGVGGIATARVSGPGAVEVVTKIWRGRPLSEAKSHTASLGTVLDSHGRDLDQAVATVYRTPRSFTGQDVVELSVHGSVYVQRELLRSLVAAGAVMAEPGEFTRRAFLAGKMDLSQAEAVADVIASQSRAAQAAAMAQMKGAYSARLQQLREQLVSLCALLELELDFSEEDVEFASRTQLLSLAQDARTEIERLRSSFAQGNAIKSGIPVAIAGATNAGKSSLLNRLLGDDRAIVSDIHGTTRDVVEDTLVIGDYLFRLMDTAGLRNTSDTIERMGIERSRAAVQRAVVTLLVIDGSSPVAIDLPDAGGKLIVVVNKSDLPASPDLAATLEDIYKGHPDAATVSISASEGTGIDALREAIVSTFNGGDEAPQDILVTNERHYDALTRAMEALSRAIEAIETGLSGELIAQDLRHTTAALGEILGQITTPEILATIFSRFCVGK